MELCSSTLDELLGTFYDCEQEFTDVLLLISRSISGKMLLLSLSYQIKQRYLHYIHLRRSYLMYSNF
jgi:hypothetical protein